MRAFLTPILYLLLALGSSAAFGKNAKASAAAVKAPVKKPSADELVRKFTFIGDFETKEETRSHSKEIFWRYPTTLPKVGFEIKLPKSPEVLKETIPLTLGEGRAVQHLNSGRVHFLEGNYEAARQTWLSGRARFGKAYPFHRRNDYFIATAFLYKSYDYWLAHGKKYDLPELRQDFINGNAFLTAAFDKKRDLPDELLDKVAPSAYYNQAAILYNYERWAGVVGAATLGLDYLRKTGRTEYRREFHRMLAEVYIKNQDYLEAVQEIDMTLRQDHDVATAGSLFARVGDIYFANNNFELAEEVYEAANRIDGENRQIFPSRYVLRGESLFWMGRYEEARKNLNYALQAMALPKSQETLDDHMQALVSLRIADSWLAERQLEKAKLSYFSHAQDFRGHVSENYAKIRLACLELPYYDGNNIKHAREVLAELKDQIDAIPVVAQEIAWTCEMASYAQHERNAEMVDRVRRFAQLYPDSGLLQSLVVPVRAVQATAIDEYFKANDPHGAVLFFEKTRASLYPEVSDDLAKRLFVAYVDTHQSEKSEPFFAAYAASHPENLGKLRLLVAAAELVGVKSGKARAEWLSHIKTGNDAFLKDGVFFERQKEVLQSIDRILATPGADPLIPWILKQALRWTEDDISVGCDRVFPLLRSLADRRNIPNELKMATEAFIDRYLKDLLRFETNCAYSLMEYELSQSRLKKGELVEKYLKRDFLPLDANTMPMFWNLAEQALEEGDLSAAQKVWTLLVQKGDPKQAEVRYSKARLDTYKTELEGLWNK